MIKIHDVQQGSNAWHELRKDKWTGSRAVRLLQDKSLPDDSSDYQSPAMKRGQLLEPIALREYTVQTGIDPLTVGFVTNDGHPNAGYSPDGVAGDTLLEVKCLNGKRHQSLAKGHIPLEYMAQIHFGMVICGLTKAKLLAFNPETTPQLTIIDIPYDPAIADNIRVKLDYDRNKRYGIK